MSPHSKKRTIDKKYSQKKVKKYYKNLNFNKQDECIKKTENNIFQHPKNPNYKAVFPFIIDYNEANNTIFNNILSDDNGLTIDKWIERFSKNKKKEQPISDDYFYKIKQEITYKLQSSVYELISSRTVTNTFNYLFQKFSTGIYVQIKNNTITHFIPFINTNYVNDWSKLINIPGEDIKKFYENKKENLGGKINYEPNIDLWKASNCLIHTEKTYSINDSNWSEIYQMIEETCNTHKINDVDFFMNTKTFPLLRNDFREPFNYIHGDDKLLTSQYYTSYHPILSTSSNEKFGDLTYPSAEDWRIITKDYFRNNCENKYASMKCDQNKGDIEFDESYSDFCESNNLEWTEKINKAYFIGDSTACGTNTDDNIKLKLVDYSRKHKDFIEAHITRLSRRDKLDLKTQELKYINPSQLPFDSIGIQNGKHGHYKYLLSIPGYTIDYEFPYYLSLGSLVFKIESEYSTWYDHLLKPFVHYIPIKKNLSNLVPLIKWANENQEIVYKIAKNGQIAYNKFFTRKTVINYWEYLLNSIANHRLNLFSLEEKYQKYESELKILQPTLMPPPDVNKVNFKDNKLAIIIPFIKLEQKNKTVFKEYIEELTNKLSKYPKLKYKIIVCEQFRDNRRFNKGQLINIGLLIAKSHGCTHTVISTINNKITDDIIQYYIAFSDADKGVINIAFNWNDYYQKNYLSWICLWNINMLIKIGGYSNQIWNWGCADKIVYHRYCKHYNKLNLSIKIPILHQSIEKYDSDYSEQIIDPHYQHLKILNDWYMDKYDDINVLEKYVEEIINLRKPKKEEDQIEKYDEKLKILEKFKYQNNVEHYVFKLFSELDLIV